MKYLTVAEVLALHDYQIVRFGGRSGILNLSLLESAVSRVKTNISGSDMYGSVFQKAAVLAYSLIKNHPFVDGNKRTGLHSALTFIELNGYKVEMPSSVLVNLGVAIATDKMTLADIEKTFTKYSSKR